MTRAAPAFTFARSGHATPRVPSRRFDELAQTAELDVGERGADRPSAS